MQCLFTKRNRRRKKIKLEETIKCLENLSNTLEQTIQELKKIFVTINDNKEELKSKNENIFTKIRNAFNNREDELLLEKDKYFNDNFTDEDIIKESEKNEKRYIKNGIIMN